jgi:F0F1-type ATP synthase assembly protein I
MPKELDELGKAYRASNSLVGFGFQIAGAFMLFVGGGYWLDGKFATSPLFILIGVVFALTAMGTLIWKLLRELDKKKNPPSAS